MHRLRTFVLAAACCVVVHVPLGAQDQAPQRPPDDPSGRGTQTLTFDSLFSLQYPETWSEAPSLYRNARVLYNLRASELDRLNPRANAYGRGERIARLMITTETRLSHEDAVQRLRTIAQSREATTTYLEIDGWPAVRQRYLVRRQLKGDAAFQEVQPGEALPPERLNLRVTTAVAAGSMLIRLEATLPPTGSAALERQVDAIVESLDVAGESVATDLQGTLAALRTPALRTEIAGLAPGPGPAAFADGPEPDQAGELPLPGAGVTSLVRLGASELEIAVSTSGRYVVIGTNGGWSNSSDAGRTYTASTLNCPAGFAACNGDPSVAVGASGNFYAAIIGWPTGNPQGVGTNSTVIYQSTNNGQTFTFVNNAVVCQNQGAGSCFADQEHITADRNLTGTGGGDQVYSTWRNFDATDQDPAIVCSQDGGQNWTAPFNVGAGFVPRIGIGGDGFVYVIYRSGNTIMLHKFEPCRDGMDPVAGFPVAVTVVNDVTCPVPGLDRCNDGNILSSHTVAVDDTNPQHVYVAFATSTAAGVNEHVIVKDSLDGGASWPIFRLARVNANTNARRYMPWVCTVGGTAYVTWFDRRFSNPVSANDLTDFFGGSVSVTPQNELLAGPEFRLSAVSDPNCFYGGGAWPCAPRATGDSESCSVQPQLAGVCQDAMGNGSQQRCDFSDGGCPAGETCMTGGGCPTYGDYNGNACAAGRLFIAWASGVSQTGAGTGTSFPDTYTDSKIVCCVPQLQTSGTLAFGTSCSNATTSKTLSVCNTGKELLEVTGIASSNAQFSVVTPVPAYPVPIPAGTCFPFEVQFTPTSPGAKNGTLTISSNDPVYPTFDVAVSGTAGQPDIDTIIANSGNFGEVCVGSFKDLDLTIQNSGTCPLTVTGVAIQAGGPDFIAPGVTTFPFTIEPGNSIHVPVRFEPLTQGAKVGTVRVSSNDPDTPTRDVAVSGVSSPPDVNVTGSGEFGQVCAGENAQQVINVCNTGACPLQVTSVTTSCADFTIVNNPFPATVAAGECIPVTVAYTPTSLGEHSCQLVVATGNDPDEPTVQIPLHGITPAPTLSVGPDQAFPPTVIQTVGACESRLPFSIVNTGACPATVSAIVVGGVDGADYGLSGAPPLPVTLLSGEHAGDGALETVFHPSVLDRDRLGSVTVSWLSDPIAGTTTDVTRLLCGEGVHTGARVLVRQGGAPVALVAKLQIQRLTANRNRKIVDTVDVALNLPLQTWTPAAGTSCQPFSFHREYGTVGNPILLAPGSYVVTATIKVGKRNVSKTVSFDTDTCGFNPTIVIDF